MPLPTWYRIMRTLPGVIGGLGLIVGGISLITAPIYYRDPNNPKLVAQANDLHPVAIGIGAGMLVLGLFALYFGATRFNRMPERLREYSYEQLRLGQAVTREIIRLCKGKEFPSRTIEYQDGSEMYLSAWSYFHRNRNFIRRLIEWMNFGFGGSVDYAFSQPGTEVDGVLHVPRVSFYMDTFTGKASRNERLDKYNIVERSPEYQEGSFGEYAVRQMIEEDPDSEDALRPLIEPQFELVRAPRQEIDDPTAYYRFMRQMGLDKPSAEELRIALDLLQEVTSPPR